MPTRYTTAQVVEAVSQHPERWAKVTRESALSLPVPTGSVGTETLAFFYYPIGGPIQNRVVRVPTFQVTADLNRLDNITFQPAIPAALGLSAEPGAPLGAPRVGGPVGPGELDTLKSALYAALDSLLGRFLSASPLLDTEKEAVTHLNTLYQRLAVIVLLPAYRALNPAFFVWLEQNSLAAPE